MSRGSRRRTRINLYLAIAIMVSMIGVLFFTMTTIIKERNGAQQTGEEVQEEQQAEEASQEEQQAEEPDPEEQQAEEAAAREQEKQERIAEEKAAWYLILVNPWNGIPDDYDIETADIEDGYVADVRIQDALREMLADCRAAGYSPMIVSTFRTRETQQYLYDHTANKADTAVPGHSEHECGLAADIIDSGSAGWSDPLIDEQEEMPTQIWLMEHCQDYGFILRYPKDKEEITGIIYEPWHYRYVGKEHAAIIMSNGLCLEEYLENMEAYYDPE